MRAAVIRNFRSDLSLETVPDPVCEPDGVVLRVLACGICRSDWHGWVGEHPKVRPGAIPGHEYCGEVVQSGPLSPWRVGDRVIAPFILSCGACPECRSGQTTTCRAQRVPGFGEPGAYAEYVSAPYAHNLARLPDALTPALAAGLGCRVTTAFHALTGRAALQAGEWLAVHGTGGVGLSVLLIGRALGARVIVVDVVPSNGWPMRCPWGPRSAIDARERRGGRPHMHRGLTGGGAHVSRRGAWGSRPPPTARSTCLRPLGRHVQVGPAHRPHRAVMNINMNAVYMKQLALYGTRGMPSWRYPSLLSLIETGRVDVSPIVARQVPLSGASAELRAFDAPMPPGVAVITDFAG